MVATQMFAKRRYSLTSASLWWMTAPRAAAHQNSATNRALFIKSLGVMGSRSTFIANLLPVDTSHDGLGHRVELDLMGGVSLACQARVTTAGVTVILERLVVSDELAEHLHGGVLHPHGIGGVNFNLFPRISHPTPPAGGRRDGGSPGGAAWAAGAATRAGGRRPPGAPAR